MRLINLDEMEKEDILGKTAILRFLTTYEKNHHLEELTIEKPDYTAKINLDTAEIELTRKGAS